MRRGVRLAAAAIILAAAGTAIPCAAQAAFTASASAAMPVSTLALTAPDGVFTATCIRDATGPFHTFTLTADSLREVNGATGYEVVLDGPAGERVTKSFDQGSALVTFVKKKGDWTYAVRAIFTATATNIWTGPPSAPQAVTCDRD